MAEKFSSGLQLLNEMDEKPIAATAAACTAKKKISRFVFDRKECRDSARTVAKNVKQKLEKFF